MSISFIAVTQPVAVLTSPQAVTYPAGTAAGDLVLLGVSWHPWEAEPAPTGFNLLASTMGTTGGTARAGGDSKGAVQWNGGGARALALYYRITDGTEGASISVSFTGVAICAAAATWRKTTGVWSVSVMPSADAIGGHAASLTTASDPGILAGDTLFHFTAYGINASASSPGWSCPGVTPGAATERWDGGGTQGNDFRMHGHSLAITAGASTGSATVSFTLSSGTWIPAALGHGVGLLAVVREDVGASTALAARAYGQGAAQAQLDRTEPITHGAAAGGTTSASPTFPTGIAAGDLLLLGVASKYDPAFPDTPAGWALVARASGGPVGSPGVDAGRATVSVYARTADGTETGSLSLTFGSGNAMYARISRFGVEGASLHRGWEIRAATLSVDAVVTPWSGVLSADVDARPGDLLAMAYAANSDGWTWTLQAVDDPGGDAVFRTVSTLAPTTTLSNALGETLDAGTTQGDDLKLVTAWGTVVLGPTTGAATATATPSGTDATSPMGGLIVLRARPNAYLVAQPQGAGQATADLTTQIALATSVAASGGGVGDLTTGIALAAVASGAGAASANLTATTPAARISDVPELTRVATVPSSPRSASA